VTTSATRVLILARSAEDRATYTHYLGGHFECVDSDLGKEGFQLCEKASTGCILLDDTLRDMSGIDFLTALRDQLPGAPPPTIYLASENSGIALRALRLGAVDYIKKTSLDRAVLLHSVETAVECSELRQQLRERDERLRLAMDAGSIGTWDWNLLTDSVVWSDNLEHFVGLEPGEFAGSFQSFAKLVHPDDMITVREALKTAINSSGTYQSMFRMNRPDGSVRWTQTRGRVYRDSRGVPVRMLGVDVDITEQKVQEANLRKQQAELQSLADNVPDVLTRFDRKMRHVFVNAAATEATGIRPTQYLGKSNRDLGMPDALCDQFEAALQRVFGTGEIQTLAFTFDTPQGVTRHFESRLAPERSADGTVEYVICAATDVTARKDAQIALEASERKYSQLAELMPAILYMTTPDGLTNYVNQNLTTYAGISPPDAHGLDWTALIHSDDLERVSREWEYSLKEIVPFNLQYRIRSADGSYRWFQGRAMPQRSLKGQVDKWIGFCVEIDEQMRLQQALEESDQRKDEFLAMLGHELRNPLAPIRNACEVLRRILPPDPASAAAVAMIGRQVSQLTRLVDDLLDVSRVAHGRIVLQQVPVVVGQVIGQAIETVQSLVRERRHELVRSDSPEKVYVKGDPARLVQCVENLLTNAAKYTAPGGRIEVSTFADDSSVVVRVADNGMGIAPALLPRVFNLYVQDPRTLDRAEGGLGIGLALVKRLIEMQGGSIEARSDGIGKGATLTLRLPRLAYSEEPTAPSTVQTGPQSRRILVVDDNEDAADSFSMLLKLQGHRVETARSASAALAVAAAFAPEIIFLDIGLPDMSGIEVSRRLRELHSTQHSHIVAITGYGQPQDRANSLSAGFAAHMVKPIQFEEVTALIASLT